MHTAANQLIDLDCTKLPPAPHVLIRLIDLCHRSDVSFEELQSVIEKDTSLSTKIITLSNSAAYGQWNEVRELKRILVVLGVKTIKSIAITSAVHEFFSQFNKSVGETLGSFWLDALICAHLTRELANLTGYPYPEEAHLAGLMHQLGQLVILSQDPTGYSNLLQQVTDQESLGFKEQEQYGRNSADLAAEIISQWDIQSMLAEAVRYQHRPAELLHDTDQLIKLLNLSSQLCNRINHSNRKYLVEDHFFGLNQSVIDDLLNTSRSQAVIDARGFGIDVNEDSTIPRANIDDEAIRVELARKIRQIALLEGVSRNTAELDDISQTIKMVSDNLQLLFGFTASMFFFPDHEKTRLTGIANQSKLLPANGSYTIKLKKGRSLVSEAALLKAPLFSHNQEIFAELPIIDRQIISDLQLPSLLCLPLLHRGELMCVIAIGCDEEKAQRFAAEDELLQHFSGIIADSLHQQQRLNHEHFEQMEQKRLEMEIRTRKIIHEANNPLTVINNYLELLSMDMDQDSDNRKHLQTIKNEVSRVSQILLQLRDEQKKDSENHLETDVNQLIGNLTELFKPTFYKLDQIESELDFDREMPLIDTDQNKLKQIITNLVKNAAEALPPKGKITIRTRALVILDGHQYIEISVADNGPGIDPALLNKLFTPIDTAKSPGHSGLGLTIVKKLVADLNGSIRYSQSDKSGAEFVILLPR